MEDEKTYGDEHQNLLRFKTTDGHEMVGFLVTQEQYTKKDILDCPIILQIHGLLGNFLARGTPRHFPPEIIKHGVSSLSINTRLAFAGQMTSRGILDDTIHDIDAAIAFLRYSGFKNIFLLGYSLGVSMALNWAANRDHSFIKGIILEGAHYSIPESQKKYYEKWGSDPSYDELSETAKNVLGDEPHKSANDETFVIFGSRGPDRTPMSSEIYTYKSWWFMGGPEAEAAMNHKNIGLVKSPILFLRGEHDFLVEDWEADKLAEIARAAGNKDVRVALIPGAKHDCMENPEAMIREVMELIDHHSS